MNPRICMVGSSNIDLIARVPRIPSPGETLMGSRFQMGFGGKGANQAVMAARLGAEVTVVTKLGRDVFGESTLANYRAQGIDTNYVLYDDKDASGVALIAVEDSTGQNSIIIAPGANFTLTPEEVRLASRAIQSAHIVMCQLEVPIDVTLEAFRVAKGAGGVTTILNPAPAATLPPELLQLTDILVPNEIETAMLTGMPTGTLEEVTEAARALQTWGVKTVVITLGSRGALLIDGSAEPHFVPAQAVQAVDATGAGDAFVGSFAYFLASGKTPRESVERACAIATRSVLRTGTQTSFPMREEVAELL